MPKKNKFEPIDVALEVRKSPSGGKGLFALETIPKDETVIEYTGKLLTDEEYDKSQSRYLFDIGKGKVIDGWKGGSRARYINHSCAPNCEAENHKGRIFIRTLRRIQPGEELAYNYGKEYFEQILGNGTKCLCPKCTAEREAALVAAETKQAA